MIPILNHHHPMAALTRSFLSDLESTGRFKGEVSTSLSDRLIQSTDNSIYQVLPQAVLYPKSEQDIIALFKLASQEKYKEVRFSPRGGGTGTNGQSLSTGIIIDCSRYMNNILELNLNEKWVLVEPGVVLDQLNEFLKPYDYFFAPTLSPSNRACLGGMLNTDASGKGSHCYGKTSQHVLEITSVFTDGQLHTSKEVDLNTVDELKKKPGRVGDFYRQLEQTLAHNQQEIAAVFPNLTRFVTGYNLTRIYSQDGSKFNANAVLTGSEGTLSLSTKIKLQITPIPKYKCLFVVLYSSFRDALRCAKELTEYEPEAIETMDDMVLGMAKKDSIYNRVKTFVSSTTNKPTLAINLIEFVANERSVLKSKIESLRLFLENDDYHFVDNPKDIKHLWELRKRSVGLLGKVSGSRKPISGVEDTLVPPEHLAEYVDEFRKILDEHGLQYGMFGHIDVGCLHVRPAFDLHEEKDRKKYYEITDKVFQLTKKYGGVLWGEHGKGFRSEYVPLYFGEKLYHELQKIKAACDPHNQLNPGKIAVPIGREEGLANIRSHHTRAKQDTQINARLSKQFALSLHCNGNGQCFNYSEKELMCPSYKVTRNRIHSPKGRANLIREWTRQISTVPPANYWPFKKIINSIAKQLGKEDFSHQVYHAMQGCLSCQACKSQCPVSIDIPSLKAKFLEIYHSRYCRSLQDYLIAYSEHIAYIQCKTPALSNRIMKNKLSAYILNRVLGIIDPPLLSSPNVNTLLKNNNIPLLNLKQLPDPHRAVVIIQDAVTSFYEANVFLKTALFLKKIGVMVYVAPWFANGKTLFGTGMLKKFRKLALKNSHKLEKLHQLGFKLIGIEPSMTLSYRFEYKELLDKKFSFNVQLLQEYLIDILQNNPSPPLRIEPPPNSNYILLSHCTEKANCFDAESHWVKVFSLLGLSLSPANVGCCGMAGSYGHDSKHVDNSHKLFDLSWKHLFINEKTIDTNLVDGYSCRAQIKRLTGHNAKHPIEILLQHLSP